MKLQKIKDIISFLIKNIQVKQMSFRNKPGRATIRNNTASYYSNLEKNIKS